jgi:hypothetical protein
MVCYKLSKHVKYRAENDHILLCDCKNLYNFQLPLENMGLLHALRGGYDPARVSNYKDAEDIIEDMLKTGLVYSYTLNG